MKKEEVTSSSELMFPTEDLYIYWRIGHYYLCHRRHCDPVDYPDIGKLRNIVINGGNEDYMIVYHSPKFIGVRPFALNASGLWAVSIKGRDATDKIRDLYNSVYYTKPDAKQCVFITLTSSNNRPTEDWPSLYTLQDIVDAKPQIGMRVVTAMLYYVKLDELEKRIAYEAYMESYL